MQSDNFKLKDYCRQQLTKYLIRAFAMIPANDNCSILDMGCGTGVPSMALVQHFNCTVYAVDQDEEALRYLKQKIADQNLNDRIIVSQQSVFDLDFAHQSFDIILAEGLLNVIGFETGFPVMDKYLKSSGYLIIHDEYKDDDQKMKFVQQHNYSLISSFVLDETVWWSNFYKPMEQQLQSLDESVLTLQYQQEQHEIRQYLAQPDLFRSIYYVLKKNE